MNSKAVKCYDLFSRAEGIICGIPVINCDGVVTNREGTKNNGIKMPYK